MYGKKLRELRKLEGWTQEEVARRIGVSKQTYSHYEKEQRKPSLKTIRELAAVYQVNIDDIFAEEKRSDLVNLPIVGRIRSGEETDAYEDIEGYEPAPKQWLEDGEYFYLRAKGDSMSGARINDGDLVLVRRQPEVERGQIAAVCINGGELSLRRLIKDGRQTILKPENLHYDPVLSPPADVVVVGRAVRVVATL